MLGMRGGAVGPAQLQPKGPLQPKPPDLANFETNYWAPDREQVLADMRNPQQPPVPNWGEYQGDPQGGLPPGSAPGHWGMPGGPQGGMGGAAGIMAPRQSAEDQRLLQDPAFQQQYRQWVMAQGPGAGDWATPTIFQQQQGTQGQLNMGGAGGWRFGQGGFMPLSNFANGSGWGGLFGNLFTQPRRY